MSSVEIESVIGLSKQQIGSQETCGPMQQLHQCRPMWAHLHTWNSTRGFSSKVHGTMYSMCNGAFAICQLHFLITRWPQGLIMMLDTIQLTHLHTSPHVHIRVCVHTNSRARTNTHKHKHAHTHIRTRTHAHACQTIKGIYILYSYP